MATLTIDVLNKRLTVQFTDAEWDVLVRKDARLATLENPTPTELT